MNDLTVPRPAAAPSLRTVEWVVWGVISLAITTVSISTHPPLYGMWVPIAFVLGIVQGGSVLLAVVRPWWGAGAQLVAVIAIALTTDPAGGPWPMPVVGMVALAATLVAIGLRAPWFVSVALWAGSMIALMVIAIAATSLGLSDGGGAVVADLSVTASTTGLANTAAVIVQVLMMTRADARVAREQADAEREIVLWQQERSRIAREMHDVVAHSMSVVHMRATSARYRLDGLDEDAAAEFDGIAEQARGALREMRALLGVLREDDRVLDAPQPGFAELPALVEATRAAGVEIDTTPALGEAGPLGDVSIDSSVQLAFYRVAQESLSNAVRHAPGASVFVGLERIDDELWLTVENGRPDAEAATDAAGRGEGGHGIRGMMERMAAVGGVLEHGPLAGGYRVVARVEVP